MARRISWLLALLAYAAPTIWGYLASSRAIAEAQVERGWVCGLPILGIYLLALFAAGLLSLFALGFAAYAYREPGSSRSRRRKLEVLGIGLPFLISVLVLLALLATGI